MQYVVRHGDSPAIIARRFGTTVAALIHANPHKHRAIVAGRHTWRALRAGETINVPAPHERLVPGRMPHPFHRGRFLHGIGVGDAVTDAIAMLMAAGNPCEAANVGLVCMIQQLLGVTIDGKWGNDTSSAARRYVPGAPGPCTPRPSWWAPIGQSSCPAIGPPPPPVSIPSSIPSPIPAPMPISVPTSATYPDPCDPTNVGLVCAAQASMGVTIDGKWGNETSAAARRLNPDAPGPCTPRPSWWAPVGQSNCGAPSVTTSPGINPNAIPGVIPISTSSTTAVPAAVQALLSINPCDQANVALICAAQLALGVTVDGKYGVDTSTAAYRLSPMAPPACTPRPSWWAPVGQSNCTGVTIPGTNIPIPTDIRPPSSGGTTPSGGTTTPTDVEVITPPVEKKGVSAGAIVAGGIGAASLVGLVTYAAMRKKRKNHG